MVSKKFTPLKNALLDTYALEYDCEFSVNTRKWFSIKCDRTFLLDLVDGQNNEVTIISNNYLHII